MKKYLFLMISILSLFFITDRVNALSYTATNGQEYTVDSEEKLLDYCYFTYVKATGNIDYNFSLTKTSTGTYKFFVYDSNFKVSFYNNKMFYLYLGITMQTYTYYEFKSNYNFSSSSTSRNTTISAFIYSSHDIYTSSSFDTISFSSNTSVTDIESRYGAIPTYTITYYVNNELYQTVEVEEGSSHELLTYSFNDNTHIFSGWQYDEAIDFNNITSDIIINATLEEKDVIPVYIDFPINKTEFYALLLLNAISIIMNFLKWCFPMKGGKNK